MINYRVPLFLAVFITSLFIGYKTGEHLDPLGDLFNHQSDALAKPGMPIPDNNQFNFLIIGVDEIEHSNPQLEGIWLAAHAENSYNITLVPIFPSIDDPKLNIILSHSISIDDRRINKEFWDAMRETKFWWNGYVIVDRTSLISLIDKLGEVNIHGQYVSGQKALDNITSWHEDISASINHQKLLIESICQEIATSQPTNRKEIFNLLEDGYRSIAQTDFTITGWIAGASGEEKFNCGFPTMSNTP